MQFAIFSSAKDTQATQVDLTLKQFSQDFQTPPVIPALTREQYQLLPPDVKQRYKHGRCYNICATAGGRTNKDILSKGALTLDLDNTDYTILHQLREDLKGINHIIHPTISSTPDKLKLRVIIPLSEPLTPAAYTILSERYCKMYGTDPAGNKPAQIMFYPKKFSNDEHYFCEVKTDGKDLEVSNDELLKEHEQKENEVKVITAHKREQNLTQNHNPNAIHNQINEKITVNEVLDTFPERYVKVGDKYAPIGKEDRAGLVVLNDGKILFSHHGNDPLHNNGKGFNTWSLIKFLVGDDLLQIKEYLDQNFPDLINFPQQIRINNQVDPDDVFIRSFNGNIKSLAWNHTQAVKELYGNDLKYDEFKDEYLFKHKILKDGDEREIINECTRQFGFGERNEFSEAIKLVAEYNTFNSIQELIKNSVWDGKPRLETYLLEYAGCEDNTLTREASKKHLLGLIYRIFETKGYKHDYMIVLTGGQGIKKSTLFQALAIDSKYYNENIVIRDDGNSDNAEQLQGITIADAAELSGLSFEKIADYKKYLTQKEDNYRKKYGKKNVIVPRRCIFWGTTNEPEFLTDSTGNRRFIVLPCFDHLRKKDAYYELPPTEALQIYAEAYQCYLRRETTLLSPEAEALQKKSNSDHSITIQDEDIVNDYMNIRITPDFYTGKYSPLQRADYIQRYLPNPDSAPSSYPHREFFTTRSLIDELTEQPILDGGKPNCLIDPFKLEKRLKHITQRVGWTKIKDPQFLSGYKVRQRRYVRPAAKNQTNNKIQSPQNQQVMHPTSINTPTTEKFDKSATPDLLPEPFKPNPFEPLKLEQINPVQTQNEELKPDLIKLRAEYNLNQETIMQAKALQQYSFVDFERVIERGINEENLTPEVVINRLYKHWVKPELIPAVVTVTEKHQTNDSPEPITFKKFTSEEVEAIARTVVIMNEPPDPIQLKNKYRNEIDEDELLFDDLLHSDNPNQNNNNTKNIKPAA